VVTADRAWPLPSPPWIACREWRLSRIKRFKRGKPDLMPDSWPTLG
jgi:hypothetical protein